MDWITHSSAGVFIAWSAPRRWLVPKAVPLAVAGALLPDMDLFIEPLLKDPPLNIVRLLTPSLE